MPTKASEDNHITQAFVDKSKNIKIADFHDYPRPDFSLRATPANMNFSPLNFSTEKKGKTEGIPFSAILPLSNSFMNSGRKIFTEPAIGFGLSAPIPEKYIGIKDTGVFSIVSNNLNGASTLVAGAGWVPVHMTLGKFQGNLGVSGEVVCVEHGDKSKISPNPGVGTCGLFGSIYSSLVNVDKNSIFNGLGVQAIVTPAINRDQDTVFTIGGLLRF